LYCICRSEYDGEEFMIACDDCLEWFHGRCIGIRPSEATAKEYYCDACKVKRYGKNVVSEDSDE
ncbi:hypothetical protein BDK51DRAFT_16725, partial [Blyttiomyces helicus]